MHPFTDVAAPSVTETALADLVQSFYAKVRRDELIGSLFNSAIDDWPTHLEKLTRFWSSIMLTSGSYKGNPMAAHTKHAADITPDMFSRWLALWAETTAEVFAPEDAERLQGKARHIARSLMMALEFHAGQSSRLSAGQGTVIDAYQGEDRARG